MRLLDDFTPRELSETFESHYVSRDSIPIDRIADANPTWTQRFTSIIREKGFATLDGVRSRDDFLAVAGLIGSVRIHRQTNERGVTTLITSDRYEIQPGGIIRTPRDNEQLFHTDGSLMVDPPDAVAVYCERPDPHGPRINVFARAAIVYRTLAEENPDLLEILLRPISFGEVSSPVFYKNSRGNLGVRYRQAPELPRMNLSDDMRAQLEEVLRRPDIMEGTTLPAGGCVVFDNSTLFHGLARAIHTLSSDTENRSRLAHRVQITTPESSPIGNGFTAIG